MEIAPHVDHIVLFSGDGDFRSLVEAIQRKGVRVTVVSTISTQPPMVADELRRQADIFLDIIELQSKIGRDPSERACPRAARDRVANAANAANAVTHRNSCSGRPRRNEPAPRMSSTTKTERPRAKAAEAVEAEPPRDCPLCPRLVAFRHQWRAREPDWFNAPVHSFGPLDARLLIVGLAPGLRGANRTGRPFTGDYAGDLLYATLERIRLCPRHVRCQAGRRPDPDRCPHHQRGALRAAGKQADAGRDQHLPRGVSCASHQGDAAAARHRGARPHRA